MTRSRPLRYHSTAPALGDVEWRALREMVLQETGVPLGASKRSLLIARLGKRLAELRLDSYADYLTHLLYRDPMGEERQRMINAITTHKTEFFREAGHFRFLHQWSAERARAMAARGGMRVWCAACSTGQEAYTLAAVLSRTLSPAEWDVLRILATDIDTQVLACAHAGRYPRSSLAEIPPEFHELMFEPSLRGDLQIRASLQRVVQFQQCNLVRDSFPGPFDVIFCRNVLMYFDAETRRSVIENMTEVLRPSGLLVLAHVEALPAVPRMLKQVASAVYEKATVDSRAPVRTNSLQIGAHGWARAFVRDGVLLSIRSGQSRLCGVTYVSAAHLADLKKRASDIVAAVRVDGEPLEGKVVRVRSRHASSSEAMASIPNELQQAGIGIVADACHDRPFRSWVELATGRVLVQEVEDVPGLPCADQSNEVSR